MTAPRRPGQQPPPPAGAAGQGTGPGPAGTPVQISVLGPLQITAAGREIGTGLRKARELLAFLTVHPDGATGEAISEALWPGAPPGHGTRQRNVALRKARELLRGATGLTTPMWITLTAGRYRLDPALTGTDLQRFQAALETARTAGDDQARLAALRQAVACYRGPLADGAGYDWAEPYAETARRRALDAWARIAEILQPADPEQALAALEAALTHDPYNEYTYQQIMRLQAAAGRADAVRRTLALLESRLGELEVTPGASTRQLAAALLGTGEPPQRQQPASAAAQHIIRPRRRQRSWPSPMTMQAAGTGKRARAAMLLAAGAGAHSGAARSGQHRGRRREPYRRKRDPPRRKQDKTSAKREGGRNAAARKWRGSQIAEILPAAGRPGSPS